MMMRDAKACLAAAACAAALAVPAVSGALPVRNYRAFTAELAGPDGTIVLLALRRFSSLGREYYLAVDPRSLTTSIVPARERHAVACGFGTLRAKYRNLPYFRALTAAERNGRRLQNAGVTRIPGRAPAVYFTADLCPAKRPLDRGVFGAITDGAPRPVPVAISVSGRWMEIHARDLRWLAERDRKGEIAVTWVNHSYRHRSLKRASWRSNFMLMKGTRPDEEILKTEELMIERGLTPSVIFRFPGLISDGALVRTVTGFGLITLGSDAWFGKGQWPRAGSVILVHVNGQEPAGLARLNRYLRSRARGGAPPFCDIRAGLADLFSR